jgi:hypothetical protein
LALLEDEDEFKLNKLSEIYNIFSNQKEVSYFHNSRKYIYYDKIVDIKIEIPKISGIIKFLEEITPREDVLIDPSDKSLEKISVKVSRYFINSKLNDC